MKHWMFVFLMTLGLGIGFSPLAVDVMAQDADGDVEMELQTEVDDEPDSDGGLFAVMMSGGIIGIVLWLALAASSFAGVTLIVDSFITVKEKKIAPPELIENVRESMEQGDVMKALQHCEEEPSALANILSAGFSNVEEGYEVVQESIAVASDMEGERLMQRVNYLNVVGNLAPMLGLLGTVQGMIFAFRTLGTQAAGAAQQAALAVNISMALSTTAAGLIVAVPAVGFFHYFRNRATNIILSMEAMTMDLMKNLRNVEVVEE